jgi:hypothetical protein
MSPGIWISPPESAKSYCDFAGSYMMGSSFSGGKKFTACEDLEFFTNCSFTNSSLS